MADVLCVHRQHTSGDIHRVPTLCRGPALFCSFCESVANLNKVPFGRLLGNVTIMFKPFTGVLRLMLGLLVVFGGAGWRGQWCSGSGVSIVVSDVTNYCHQRMVRALTWPPACCRHPSGNEPSVQSLKKLFANNTAQQASSSRAHMHAEDEDIELDREYAPKRALTTKVKQLGCWSLRTPTNTNPFSTCRTFTTSLIVNVHTLVSPWPS